MKLKRNIFPVCASPPQLFRLRVQLTHSIMQHPKCFICFSLGITGVKQTRKATDKHGHARTHTHEQAHPRTHLDFNSVIIHSLSSPYVHCHDGRRRPAGSLIRGRRIARYSGILRLHHNIFFQRTHNSYPRANKDHFMAVLSNENALWINCNTQGYTPPESSRTWGLECNSCEGIPC